MTSTDSNNGVEWLDLSRIRPRKSTLVWGGLITAAEILVLGFYYSLPGTSMTTIRHNIYPFVWINVGLWAVVRTEPRTSAGGRYRYLAAGASLVYFVLLMYFGGLFDFNPVGYGFSIKWLSPGWGPAVYYSGETFWINLIPFKTFGYAVLSYLVYSTVLDTSKSVVSGVFGLFSCVSCTWPIFTAALTSALGTGSALTTTIYSWSYGLSTLVFLTAVALLYWKPY
ncbi:MAG: hypothetical protein SV253_04810 [Halobacteria archaeon]|nr:hypothetical protein [Halobacteria archaeon]